MCVCECVQNAMMSTISLLAMNYLRYICSTYFCQFGRLSMCFFTFHFITFVTPQSMPQQEFCLDPAATSNWMFFGYGMYVCLSIGCLLQKKKCHPVANNYYIRP